MKFSKLYLPILLASSGSLQAANLIETTVRQVCENGTLKIEITPAENESCTISKSLNLDGVLSMENIPLSEVINEEIVVPEGSTLSSTITLTCDIQTENSSLNSTSKSTVNGCASEPSEPENESTEISDDSITNDDQDSTDQDSADIVSPATEDESNSSSNITSSSNGANISQSCANNTLTITVEPKAGFTCDITRSVNISGVEQDLLENTTDETYSDTISFQEGDSLEGSITATCNSEDVSTNSSLNLTLTSGCPSENEEETNPVDNDVSSTETADEVTASSSGSSGGGSFSLWGLFSIALFGRYRRRFFIK